MKKLAVFLCLSLTLPLVSMANTAELSADPYYQIREVHVQVLEDSEGASFQELSDEEGSYVIAKTSNTGVGEVLKEAREIIAFGKEIYEIIKAGKPVVTSSHAPISVLPNTTKLGKDISPMNLSNWKGPKSVKYAVTYVNGFGMNVIEFIYNINLSYGGTFNKKGAYITNAQIVPEHISVAWGYSFDATMKLVGMTNQGSEDYPIAGATLSLSYTISTVIKEERKNLTFFLSGVGEIKQL